MYDEYCYFTFLKGTEREFSYIFRKPIEAGQHRDSSSRQVKIMRNRISDLNRLLQNIIHRRDLDVLRSYLPPKFEYSREIGLVFQFLEKYYTIFSYQNQM